MIEIKRRMKVKIKDLKIEMEEIVCYDNNRINSIMEIIDNK